ncbi:MAG: lysylphosphatidylglycerol synthase domain-containing protein [Acidobacteriota bacterium]
MTDSGQASNKFRRIFLRLAKVVLAVVVLAAVSSQLSEALGELDKGALRFSPFYLVCSAFLYLSGMALFGDFWHLAVGRLGVEVGRLESQRAYFVSQLGKYVPGKAWVVLIRCGLTPRDRFPLSLVLVSSIYEALSVMGTAAAVAALAFLLIGGSPAQLALLSAGTAGLLLLASHPPVFPRLVSWVSASVQRDGSLRVPELEWKVLFGSWYRFLGGWALVGLSILSAARGGGISFWGVQPFLLATGGIGLAVSGGFLLFLLPAGLGVREYILLQVLSPSVGPAQAGLIAIVSRVVQIVAELAAGGVFYAVGKAKINTHQPGNSRLQ